MKLPPRDHNAASDHFEIRFEELGNLTSLPDAVRHFTREHERRAKRILRRFGLRFPLVIDQQNRVLVGELIRRAAVELGFEQVPVVEISGLSDAELHALSVASDRLLETGSFDRKALGSLLTRLEIEIPDLDFGDLGLEVAEIDLALEAVRSGADDEPPILDGPCVARKGDLFLLSGRGSLKHRLLVDDATPRLAMARLMNGSVAAGMFADPPYNLKVEGFVSSKVRREFVAGSGEMTPEQFTQFLSAFIEVAVEVSSPSAIHFLCMDWRHLSELLAAASPHYSALLNLCVWVKNRVGQGSGYRSQHELVFVYRVGKSRHRNNIELGKYGRTRSNVWAYDAAASFLRTEEAADIVGAHPSPKNTTMVADAILDCTARGDVVLDPFLGSGTTMIACERVGRVCHGMELDPIYADLCVRRWQATTGQPAIHDGTGLTFDELAAQRAIETADD